jgi:hypothetical protein
MITELYNWCNGWRWDLDGFLVRARKQEDPEHIPSEMGFVSECCIAVRDHGKAKAMDVRRKWHKKAP